MKTTCVSVTKFGNLVRATHLYKTTTQSLTMKTEQIKIVQKTRKIQNKKSFLLKNNRISVQEIHPYFAAIGEAFNYVFSFV